MDAIINDGETHPTRVGDRMSRDHLIKHERLDLYARNIDVPIKGAKSRYMEEDGTYEMIKGNPGIRRFVWEHFQNLNKVVQRMKYCGGMFSGLFICRRDHSSRTSLYCVAHDRPITSTGII